MSRAQVVGATTGHELQDNPPLRSGDARSRQARSSAVAQTRATPRSSSHAALSAAQCATATAWATWVPYSVGALVRYSGATYSVPGAHERTGMDAERRRCALGAGHVRRPVADRAAAADSSRSGSSRGAWRGRQQRVEAAAADRAAADHGRAIRTPGLPGSKPRTPATGTLASRCGWTATNEGQGYHCATTSWGTGCEPGGATCWRVERSSSGIVGAAAGRAVDRRAAARVELQRQLEWRKLEWRDGARGRVARLSPYKDTASHELEHQRDLDGALRAATSLGERRGGERGKTVARVRDPASAGAKTGRGGGRGDGVGELRSSRSRGQLRVVDGRRRRGAFTCGTGLRHGDVHRPWASSNRSA